MAYYHDIRPIEPKLREGEDLATPQKIEYKLPFQETPEERHQRKANNPHKRKKTITDAIFGNSNSPSDPDQETVPTFNSMDAQVHYREQLAPVKYFKEPKDLKVLIVGAGMAGLYTALLLQDLGISSTIVEARQEIGGRARTHNFSGDEAFNYVDFGAMRFPLGLTFMKRLLRLMTQLHMHSANKALAPYRFYTNENLQHYNGKTITRAEAAISTQYDPLHFASRNNNGRGVFDSFVNQGAGFFMNSVFAALVAQAQADFEKGWTQGLTIDRFSTRQLLEQQKFVNNAVPLTTKTLQWLETTTLGTTMFEQSALECLLLLSDFQSKKPTTKVTDNNGQTRRISLNGDAAEGYLPPYDVDIPEEIPSKQSGWVYIAGGTIQLAYRLAKHIGIRDFANYVPNPAYQDNDVPPDQPDTQYKADAAKKDKPKKQPKMKLPNLPKGKITYYNNTEVREFASVPGFDETEVGKAVDKFFTENPKLKSTEVQFRKTIQSSQVANDIDRVKVFTKSVSNEGDSIDKKENPLKEETEWDHVISTVPLSVLQAIKVDPEVVSYNKRTGIRTLGYENSCKIGLKFKTRWWYYHYAITGGQSSTDLPLRTVVYPSYPYSKDYGKAPGVMLASYCWAQDANRMAAIAKDPAEMRRICIENLAAIHSTEVINERFLLLGAPSWAGWTVEQVRAELDSQLEEVSHIDWNNEIYNRGAFAMFLPSQFSDILPDVIVPEMNGRLHIAGEAASLHHGWIIGSLNSAYRCVHELLVKQTYNTYRHHDHPASGSKPKDGPKASNAAAFTVPTPEAHIPMRKAFRRRKTSRANPAAAAAAAAAAAPPNAAGFAIAAPAHAHAQGATEDGLVWTLYDQLKYRYGKIDLAEYAGIDIDRLILTASPETSDDE